jgi:Dolichyl-phosphate-mannose-protein mannosyltransferase
VLAARQALAASWAPLAGVLVIYGVAVLIYAQLASFHILPDLFPDEVYYGKLSQNLALGHGLTWRGASTGLPPAWPALLSLAWHGSSAVHGFAVAKVIGCFAACLTIVPVWLLGRELVGPRLALIPAMLSIAGAWMEMTGQMASENLAYPVATAALCSTVMAVRRPGWRWFMTALALCLLGTLTRVQLFVLPIVLVVAILIDVARQPAGARMTRFRQHPWPALVAIAIVVAVGILVIATHPSVIRRYPLANLHTSVGHLIVRSWQQGLALAVMTIAAPVVATLALAARRRNWRDEIAGPLLCVLLAAAVCFVGLAGRFTAAVTQGPVERYVVYVVPLLLLAMVVARGRVGLRAGLIAATALAAGLLTLSPVTNYLEQPALFGAMHRLWTIGFSEQHAGGVALFALLAGLAGAWLLVRGRLALLALLVLVGMVVESQMSQDTEKHLLASARPTFAPPDLDWVARATHQRVAALNINGPVQLRGTVNFYTELFSPNVSSAYSTVNSGRVPGTCPLQIDGHGFLKAPAGRCSNFPSYFVYQAGGPYLAHFYGQQLLADAGRSGRLLKLGRGTPRLMSLIGPPCQPTGCSSTMEVGAFVDRPASAARSTPSAQATPPRSGCRSSPARA